MKKYLMSAAVAAGVTLSLGGCGSSHDVTYKDAGELDQDVRDTIGYMFSEEHLAYDVYMDLYAFYKKEGIEIKQFTQIASNGETAHISAVDELAKQYDINVSVYPTETPYDIRGVGGGVYPVDPVQGLYDALMNIGTENDDPVDALKAGCMVEVTDINDLLEDIELAKASGADDVVATFEFLRDGSYSHYWSFDKTLKQDWNMTKGCCSWEDEWCHPEYPKP